MRLPYPLGTPATMRGRASRWGSSTRQRATSCQILRKVASALTESRRRLYPSRCGYLLGRAGKTLPEGLKTGNLGKIAPKTQKILLKIL